MSNVRVAFSLGMACIALAIAQAVRAQEAAQKTAPAGEAAVEIPVRLLERPPFDRITLDEANGNAVIEVTLLELPERRVPEPRPDSGSLTVHRLSHPSIPYSISWNAIAKIELFEQMLAAEAKRLTAAGKFDEAFEYYAFVSLYYPRLEGLEPALEDHLWREAAAAYSAGKRDEAWPVLLALYGRNPDFPRLAGAVQAVSDELIAARLKEKNYAAARAMLEVLKQSFSKLPLSNVARWQTQFEADAQEQLARARAAMDQQDYAAARAAVKYARAILPSIEGGEQLWREIQSAAPEIRVGVTQAGGVGGISQTPDWATARIRDLIDPRLVRMVDFGAEGGVYGCAWGEVATSADGLATTVQFSPAAIARGLAPGALALQLVELATIGNPLRQEDFAWLLEGVAVVGGSDVVVSWRRPHIRPETFLQTPLRGLTTAQRGPGLWFELQAGGADSPPNELRYQRTGPATAAGGAPSTAVEMVFADDEAALAALVQGDVDALDRVPPWQLESARSAEGVVVDQYRLPTVHVLVPNAKNPLMEMREFRRAISYAIDSESIVRDILLGGQAQSGFRTISGPFPAGVGLNDPAGYAYHTEIASRPYEPRLASLLAGVARTALAKREAALIKAREAANKAAEEKTADATKEETPADGAKQDAKPDEAAEAKAEPAAADPATDEPPAKPTLPPMAPLVLAHPADPVARLACQSIKLQLDLVGIPTKLVELPATDAEANVEWDLLYAELAVWEPIYDARRLLGADGVAGHASALMSLALDELDRAQNWNEARAQLKEIHRIAHYDLTLVPLWQTVNHVAYRDGLDGVGERPVTLYQNLSDWRKTSQ